MSEVKRRRSGHGGHTRSNNSSRESLQEGSGGSTASSVDLRNGGRTKGNKSARGGKLRKSLSTNGIAQGLRGSNSIQVVVTSPQGGTTPQKSLSNSNTSVNGKEAELKNASKSTGKSGSAGTHPSQSKQTNGQCMSHDRVRKIVQEEGRSARNLIAYSLPAVDGATNKPASVSKPAAPKSPRKRLVTGVGRDMSPSTRKADDTSSVKSSGSRPASSVGSQATRKTDVRARYWAFLFDNLKRAVDEIYQTCETDESVSECKEVIMILQQCTKDFQSLINQWNVIKTYEHLEESGQRPVSLAWEVRKTSPGKLHLSSRDPCTPSPAEVHNLDELAKAKKSATNSWADMVKGKTMARDLEAQYFEEMERHLNTDSPQQPTQEPPADAVKPHVLKLESSIPDLTEDVDGWETVRRSRSKVSPLSKASTSSRGSIGSNGTGKFQKPVKNGSGDTTKNNKGSNLGRKSLNEKLSNGNMSATSKGQGGNVANGSSTKRTGNGSSYRDAVIKANSNHSMDTEKIVSHSRANNSKVSASAGKAVTGSSKVSAGAARAPSAVKGSSVAGSQQAAGKTPALSADDSGSLLMVTKGSDLDYAVTTHPQIAAVEMDDEEVLAMEIEQVLSEHDEALHEQDAAIKSAIEEERSYLQEIEEAEREEMPQELTAEYSNDDDELDQGANSGLDSMETSATAMDWESLMARYEAEAERRKVLGLSWADIDEAETRTPGRGAHMHEKLSSPSRKRSIMESKRRHEERQAKAAELREKFRQEKAERVKDLTKKVEEVRSFRDKMEEQRRDYLERKLQEAEEKRKRQLKLKVKKAHEEENKANEIAFINSLSEQNKKMDIMTKYEDVKARLLDIQEERQRKIGEKAAKEAAVEERRKALDAERSARLVEMQIKRKKREEEIELEKYERDKERTEALKAKEKEHRDRVAELERLQQANIEELQKKIEQKQSESARRHNERLQNIREKAFIMSIVKHSTEDQPEAPKLQPYNTKKMCTVCSMVIPSEVHLQSHLRGQQHQSMLKEQQTKGSSWSKMEIESFNIEHITDVPGDFVDPKQASSRERCKSLKKRCKKLKQRMQARGNEFEAGLDLRQETVDSQHKAKLNKVIKDINKFMQSQEKGPWPQNKISALDRGLGEAIRILDKKVLKDQIAFRICGGLSCCTKLLSMLHDENVIHMYPKTCANVCHAIRLACRSCFENNHYLLFSNRTGFLIDLLVTRLTWMVDETKSNVEVTESATLGSTTDSATLANLMAQSCDTVDVTIDPTATALIHTLAVVLSSLSTSNQSRSSDKTSSSPRPGLDAFTSRANDVISYIITVGIVDKLQNLYTNVRGSLETNSNLFAFLQHSISFLTAITKLTASKRPHGAFEATKVTGSEELLQTYEDIELAGIMSLLYGMLLHNVPTRGETSTPPTISSNTLTVTLVGLKLVNQLATMDLHLVQRVLGAEGVSLELRHITSYLIWYCTHHFQDNEELLHEVILCVGYFVVLNSDNQAVIQSGQRPTILQQLCSLPFQYFSDPRLVHILYPCLISCCYMCEGNKLVIEEELSCDLLANFLEESLLQQQRNSLPNSAGNRKSTSGMTHQDGRMSLSARFPNNQWSDAKQYFSSETDP